MCHNLWQHHLHLPFEVYKAQGKRRRWERQLVAWVNCWYIHIRTVLSHTYRPHHKVYIYLTVVSLKTREFHSPYTIQTPLVLYYVQWGDLYKRLSKVYSLFFPFFFLERKINSGTIRRNVYIACPPMMSRRNVIYLLVVSFYTFIYTCSLHRLSFQYIQLFTGWFLLSPVHFFFLPFKTFSLFLACVHVMFSIYTAFGLCQCRTSWRVLFQGKLKLADRD